MEQQAQRTLRYITKPTHVSVPNADIQELIALAYKKDVVSKTYIDLAMLPCTSINIEIPIHLAKALTARLDNHTTINDTLTFLRTL